MKLRLARGMVMVAALVAVTAACGDDDGSGADADTTDNTAASAASVAFAGIADGDEVTSPVRFDMEAESFTVEAAGEVRDGAGHFHVIVDAGCVTPGDTIPSDTEGYHHFGKAQTEAELELEQGEHALCLQMGDGAHSALALTNEITVTVTER